MISLIIADILEAAGRYWNLKGGGEYQPTEEDIEKVLDQAAAMLYAEPTGARFSGGGLIIEKTEIGYDIYTYTGTYS